MKTYVGAYEEGLFDWGKCSPPPKRNPAKSLSWDTLSSYIQYFVQGDIFLPKI